MKRAVYTSVQQIQPVRGGEGRGCGSGWLWWLRRGLCTHVFSKYNLSVVVRVEAVVAGGSGGYEEGCEHMCSANTTCPWW